MSAPRYRCEQSDERVFTPAVHSRQIMSKSDSEFVAKAYFFDSLSQVGQFIAIENLPFDGIPISGQDLLYWRESKKEICCEEISQSIIVLKQQILMFVLLSFYSCFCSIFSSLSPPFRSPKEKKNFIYYTILSVAAESNACCKEKIEKMLEITLDNENEKRV